MTRPFDTHKASFIMSRKTWTDNDVSFAVRAIASSLGHFPSNTELCEMGRNDLACQISRRGGFFYWSDRIGIKRRHSDSDFGWAGEHAVAEILRRRGHEVIEDTAIRCPFDLLVDGVKVEVKTARFAQYGSCKGWFYRIGRKLACDVLVLLQADTQTCYVMPRWAAPETNITISRDGGIYAKYRDNFGLITQYANALREVKRTT